jgi:predicted transport protein
MTSVDDATHTQIRNIEAQTGKSLDELIQNGLAMGMDKHTAIRKFFQDEYGLTYGNANTLAILTRDKLKGAAGEEENFVDVQYSDKKAGLRPIYDALITAVESFGDDVEIAPKRTYVSLRRNKQFGLVQPSTATRVDVGINLPDVAPTERLEASGSFNSMVSHRVRLSSAEDVDAELTGWLRQAFDQA